jgi:tetraacyldisaccharide 4'-kinase
VRPEDTPQSVGEEAWMLSQQGPVFRSKDILMGAQVLATYLQGQPSKERRVIVWDDGHQYPKVHKDLSLIVTNVAQAWGNEYLCPAGPLREDLIPGLQRADMIVCLYFQAECTRYHRIKTTGVPMVPMLCQPICGLSAQTPVVGFCGLGDPTRFHGSLTQCGLEVRAFRVFPDHHTYTPKDEDALECLAAQHQAVLMTSHKDYVKLSCNMQGKTYQIQQHFTLPRTLSDAIQKILVS